MIKFVTRPNDPFSSMSLMDPYGGESSSGALLARRHYELMPESYELMPESALQAQLQPAFLLESEWMDNDGQRWTAMEPWLCEA